MRLTKRTYTSFQTKITAENLNEIQDCIIDLEDKEDSYAEKVVGGAAGNLPTLDSEGNLQDSGKKPGDYATTLSVEMDHDTYVLTVTLSNESGETLASGTVDLPIESMIIDGDYDAVNKKLILTLQNGNKIDVPIAALIDGLVPDTRTVNGKRLNANIVLYASDIALSSTDGKTIKKAVEDLDSEKISRDGDSTIAIGTDSTGIYYREVTT